MTVTIAELVDVTTSMQHRYTDLFETLGRWVTSTDDPTTQQRFARSAHRHAWHAELWSERRPTVPLEATGSEPTDVDAVGETSQERLAWYLDQVRDLRRSLAELAARIDPMLDPGTTRVITLIDADLADELG